MCSSSPYRHVHHPHFGTDPYTDPYADPYLTRQSWQLLILTVTSGFVFNVFVDSPIWACIFAIIAVGGYYAINEVAIELEVSEEIILDLNLTTIGFEGSFW